MPAYKKVELIVRRGSTGNGVRPGRTDPGFPTPGVRMTGVYTNSLKLHRTLKLFFMAAF